MNANLGIIIPDPEYLHGKRFGEFLVAAISDHIMYNQNPLDEISIVNAIRYMDNQTLVDIIHQYHGLLQTHELKGFSYKEKK